MDNQKTIQNMIDAFNRVVVALFATVAAKEDLFVLNRVVTLLAAVAKGNIFMRDAAGHDVDLESFFMGSERAATGHDNPHLSPHRVVAVGTDGLKQATDPIECKHLRTGFTWAADDEPIVWMCTDCRQLLSHSASQSEYSVRRAVWRGALRELRDIKSNYYCSTISQACEKLQSLLDRPIAEEMADFERLQKEEEEGGEAAQLEHCIFCGQENRGKMRCLVCRMVERPEMVLAWRAAKEQKRRELDLAWEQKKRELETPARGGV